MRSGSISANGTQRARLPSEARATRSGRPWRSRRTSAGARRQARQAGGQRAQDPGKRSHADEDQQPDRGTAPPARAPAGSSVRGHCDFTVNTPPSLRPNTAGLYISSACAGGRMKTSRRGGPRQIGRRVRPRPEHRGEVDDPIIAQLAVIERRPPSRVPAPVGPAEGMSSPAGVSSGDSVAVESAAPGPGTPPTVRRLRSTASRPAGSASSEHDEPPLRGRGDPEPHPHQLAFRRADRRLPVVVALVPSLHLDAALVGIDRGELGDLLQGQVVVDRLAGLPGLQ